MRAVMRRTLPALSLSAVCACVVALTLSIALTVEKTKTVVLPVPSPTDPIQILDRAKHLAWLGNWDTARDLFARSEHSFHDRQDVRNEIFAHVGYVRSTIERRSYSAVSSQMDLLLQRPTVQSDRDLRLWCLFVKGYA